MKLSQSKQQTGSNASGVDYASNPILPDAEKPTGEFFPSFDAINPPPSSIQPANSSLPPVVKQEESGVQQPAEKTAQYDSPNVLTSLSNDDDDERQQSFHFRGDPSMAYQVAIHDDIISKHSIRQQRIGLDGIDNDNRFLPSVDYVSDGCDADAQKTFFDSASNLQSEAPSMPDADDIGNPLFFLQDTDAFRVC